MADRRKALKVLAACTGAAAAGVAIAPSVALMIEARKGGGSSSSQWIRVARMTQLEPGRPLRAWVVGPQVDAWTRTPDQRIGAVWLLREGDNGVRAYSDSCPHLGCAIELTTDGHFNCPCHDSAFDLQGRRQTGPSPRDMDPVEARVIDGWVSVRFRRFRQGSAERVPV